MIDSLAQSRLRASRHDAPESRSSTDRIRSDLVTHCAALHARTAARLHAIATPQSNATASPLATCIDVVADEILADAITAALHWCERDE